MSREQHISGNKMKANCRKDAKSGFCKPLNEKMFLCKKTEKSHKKCFVQKISLKI